MSTFVPLGAALPPEFAALSGEGFVADLQTTEPGAIRALATEARPVILLNGTAERMAEALGFGLDCAGAVWHPAQGDRPHRLIYVAAGPPEVTAGEAGEGRNENPGEEAPEQIAPIDVTDTQPLPPAGADLAAMLHAAAISPPALTAADTPKIDPIPDGVAGTQFLVTEAVGTTYHPHSYTWEHRDKPITVRNQTANLSLPIFVEVYASPKPANKFVRVTTWGTGFNPGRMIQNDTWGRFFFQDRAKVSMALTGAAGAVVLDAQPRNRNNEATYTSSHSLTVGIKKGEAVEPSGSATISASVSSTLSAFRVADHSTGAKGAWDFDMQLCGQALDGIYEVERPWSLVGWYGRVWEVPGLASGTLFPACLTAWALPLDTQSKATLEVSLTQRLVYVRANWVEYYWATCGGGHTIRASVDFGAVNLP